MPEISISQQIFVKFFQNLQDIYQLDDTIISQLRKLHEENKLSEPSQLDQFIEWLEKYNAKDKESKG
jgi:hypothetical protein